MATRTDPTNAPTKDVVVTTLTMPRELRDWLRDHAKQQQRSMGAEIRHLVEQRRTQVEQKAAAA